MANKKLTFQVNFTGGIISPGHLLSLLQEAQAARVTQVQFGLRQQILLEVPEALATSFRKRCAARNIMCRPKNETTPNIVSSYPAAGLFTADTWLREDVFKDVFSQFTQPPTYKVNICDRTQNLVPLFTGHINWVSSTIAHFWHLNIRLPKTQNIINWPHLVYTNEIGPLTQKVEQALSENVADKDFATDAIGRLIQQESVNKGAAQKSEHLQLQPFSLPYYEGFNPAESGAWLGIYRRDQMFPISFLMDVCILCNESKIGELYATPWKSLIVKGIDKKDRERWNHVLGKYRINVRHAANELAWQVEDGDEQGLQIKRTIIRHFDKEDVRTYGLSFGVQSKPTASMFGSIIIRKQQVKNPHRLRSLDRYDLLYTKDFNPNAATLVPFRDGLEKEQLGVYIVSLCKMYYEQQAEKYAQKNAMAIVEPKEAKPPVVTKETVHQCPDCLTIYDAAMGDADAGIEAGTSFNLLPESYCCPLCESPKSSFALKSSVGSSLQVG
ncbi:rubredoxin [Paracnuella aquatica]|uniref:rubredoxin n=1 Tax=Paracnuella aquatica TaxID=2268757 RepID=UPI000DEFB7F4|nr:rubredoxin [Paracnuella aquatica]RPD51884.1 rubredoxin [Paracnuella aquatica]